MDSKTIAEISACVDEKPAIITHVSTSVSADKISEESNPSKEVKAPSVSTSASNQCSGSSLIQGEETVINSEGRFVVNPSFGEAEKGSKSSVQLKNPVGKKKVKVDWTPELHKKFVQAVEQLGLDKAVPSRILELMGIDCLTRHNVASHLQQKYRSHQKHVLAREAEAASWSRRRHGGAGRTDAKSWAVPTMGFPPVTTFPYYEPLHVWGHPSADQSFMNFWPYHQVPSSSPSPVWALGHPSPPTLSSDPNFWYFHHHDVPAPGMPCFTTPITPTVVAISYSSDYCLVHILLFSSKPLMDSIYGIGVAHITIMQTFPSPTVQGIPPTGMYRVGTVVDVPTMPPRQTPAEPPFDFHQPKENIDTIIGDVLSKPWLPLPLGLKPPSIDGVLIELQSQGISKIPPSCA